MTDPKKLFSAFTRGERVVFVLTAERPLLFGFVSGVATVLVGIGIFEVMK